jgi:MFS family permease
MGLVIGIPYYGPPYFYDYFERPLAEGGFAWTRDQIILGLPLGTLATLVFGPTLVHRFRPRRAIAAGALLCGVAIAGFGLMNGSLVQYYLLWLLYMTGWTFAGPLAQQSVLRRAYAEKAGSALALAYFGISFFGAFSVALVARPLMENFGLRGALFGMGALVALAAAVAHLGLPHLEAESPAARRESPAPLGRTFWLLLIGSTLSASAIGGVAQHLKLILADSRFPSQAALDAVFGWTILLFAASGALGRFVFGWAAGRFPLRAAITVSSGLMALAMPLLFAASPSFPPYGFAVLFGFGLSGDFLMVPLLAARALTAPAVGKALGIIVPVNTVGQTWFPYAISLIWSWSGGYPVPLGVITAAVILGWALVIISRDNQATPSLH